MISKGVHGAGGDEPCREGCTREHWIKRDEAVALEARITEIESVLALLVSEKMVMSTEAKAVINRLLSDADLGSLTRKVMREESDRADRYREVLRKIANIEPSPMAMETFNGLTVARNLAWAAIKDAK